MSRKQSLELSCGFGEIDIVPESSHAADADAGLIRIQFPGMEVEAGGLSGLLATTQAMRDPGCRKEAEIAASAER